MPLPKHGDSAPSAMLSDHLGAHVDAAVADHHRATVLHLAAACDQLLDLMAVGPAERALSHVSPVAPLECLEGPALLARASMPARFYLRE